MDVLNTAKDNARLQQQSFNNLFDILSLFQDHVERSNRYWAYNIGVNENVQVAVDQYLKVLRQGRDNARELINQNFNDVEVYFAGIGQKKPAESTKRR